LNYINDKLDKLQNDKEDLQKELNDKSEYLDDLQTQNSLLKSALDNKELVNMRQSEENKKLHSENEHLRDIIEDLEKANEDVKILFMLLVEI
jgi:hypothetical protein